MQTGSNDMKEHFVIDPLISKRQQLMLATQLCRMVLKVRKSNVPPTLSQTHANMDSRLTT